MSLEVIDSGLSDIDLAMRYRRCRWLLAPSLEKGFDLPVAEAPACRAPVIASDIPAHRDLARLGARGFCILLTFRLDRIS